jgi:hypothetical protein
MKETVYRHNNPDHLQASVLKNKLVSVPEWDVTHGTQAGSSQSNKG